jgi:hypothetical protein
MGPILRINWDLSFRFIPQIKNIYLVGSFLKVNNLIQDFVPNSYKFIFLTPMEIDYF